MIFKTVQIQKCVGYILPENIFVIKNGKKVKTIDGEGEANAWLNNAKKSLEVELPILKKHAPENPENKILGKQLTFINRKEGIQRVDP